MNGVGGETHTTAAELQQQVREARVNEAKLKSELLATQDRCHQLQTIVLRDDGVGGGGGEGNQSKLQQISGDLMNAINDLNDERMVRVAAVTEADRMRRECRVMEEAAMAVHAQLTRFVADTATQLEMLKVHSPKLFQEIADDTKQIRFMRFDVSGSHSPFKTDERATFSSEVMTIISDLRKLNASVYSKFVEHQQNLRDPVASLEEANAREHEARMTAKAALNKVDMLQSENATLRKQIRQAEDATSKERQEQRQVYQLRTALQAQTSENVSKDAQVTSLQAQVKRLIQKVQQLQDSVTVDLEEAGRERERERERAHAPPAAHSPAAAHAREDLVLELDLREQELYKAVAERDAARAALIRLSDDSEARISQLNSTVEQLEKDLNIASRGGGSGGVGGGGLSASQVCRLSEFK